MQKKDIVIIGSGPAGYTAALYASRANYKPLVIMGHEPGGQLTTTTDVENFPGFPNGIMGPELMSNMKEQAEKFGSEFMQTQVTEADLSKRPFILKCENGEVVSAQAVIISTGASAKYLGLANEKELIGKGVSACATCDGFFYRDQDVYVVGGGDTAMEEASFLTKFAKKVTLVHRRDTFRASKPMQQRVFDNPKIEVMWDSSVEEILFDEKGVHGLKIMNSKTGKTIEVKANGLFMGIGHTPNTQFLNKQLELDDHGFIITKNGHPDTNIPGVFACGDVQDNYYRQAISAAGTGCMAAIRAEKYLEDVGSL
ncbi:MAG: thioredoxin-disulfide reductase [Halobacteriovoraceae bacterium]|nr:thioredoxin-disulfide reductase [Halobacteriovoraceae bacterium]